MSATEAVMQKVAREEPDKFWIYLSLAMLIGLCAFNVFILLYVVPKFGQIFTDALPGRPLPEVTYFFLNYRIELAVAILVWPIEGLILESRQNQHAILWINLGIIWFFLQLGVTVYALFSPMAHGIYDI